MIVSEFEFADVPLRQTAFKLEIAVHGCARCVFGLLQPRMYRSRGHPLVLRRFVVLSNVVRVSFFRFCWSACPGLQVATCNDRGVCMQILFGASPLPAPQDMWLANSQLHLLSLSPT